MVARAAVELRARAGRRPRRRRRCSRAASTPSAGAAWTAGIPVGVFGTLIALAVSPVLGAVVALAAIRALRSIGRRATRRWNEPVRAGQWVTSAALAFSHGANDAQKAAGVVAALLLADGRIARARAADVGRARHAPLALTVGTALRRLADRARPSGGASTGIRPGRRSRQQAASAAGVILGASLARRARSPRRRWSPRRSSASAAGAGAGTTSTGRSCATSGLGVADYDAGDRRARGGGARRVEVAGVSASDGSCPTRPDVLGLLRSQIAVTDRGHGRVRRLGGGRRAQPSTRCAPASTAPTPPSASCACALQRGVRDAAGARGRLRALARGRLAAQPRQGHDQRVRGHGLPARRRRSPR